MENQKKRARMESKTEKKKNPKIETATDAVLALDDIILRPLPLPMKMEVP